MWHYASRFGKGAIQNVLPVCIPVADISGWFLRRYVEFDFRKLFLDKGRPLRDATDEQLEAFAEYEGEGVLRVLRRMIVETCPSVVLAGLRRWSVVAVVEVFGGLLVVLRGMPGRRGRASTSRRRGKQASVWRGQGGEGRSDGVELRRALSRGRRRPRERVRPQARQSERARARLRARCGESRAPSCSSERAAGEGSEGAAVVVVLGVGAAVGAEGRRRAFLRRRRCRGRAVLQRRGGKARRGGVLGVVEQRAVGEAADEGAAGWGAAVAVGLPARRGVVLFVVRASVARSARCLMYKPTICSHRITLHRCARPLRLFRRSAERGLRAAVARRCRRVCLPVRRRGVRAPGFRPGFKGLD